MDTVALVEKYPSADERVLAEKIIRSGGGPASVAAVALSRLGIKTAIIGTIGDDEDGSAVLEIFNKEKIDTSGVRIESGSTSGSVIVVSKSQSTRAISTRQPVTQSKPNEIAKKIANNSKWVHVDQVGVNLLEDLGIKRGGPIKISFDAGYGVKDFDASKVDLFAPNDRQMQERYPNLELRDAIKMDSEKGSNLVVATMGAKGSIGYSSETGFAEADAVKSEIVSSLGAGDVFHGALLAQLIEGLPLQEALHRANIVAALSCQGLDGQSAIPTKQELMTYLTGAK